ncbi:MAG: integration host factor subunit beta [Proteobacteria bacterium]|nr:integration host factor subunit beta [Pseudomonadota bacterium]
MNTKRDMAERIAEKCGITGLQAKAIVQHTLDELMATLVSEGRIELRNFGVFNVVESKARKARNPRTGETVMIEARKTVKFKMGKAMAQELSVKAESVC